MLDHFVSENSFISVVKWVCPFGVLAIKMLIGIDLRKLSSSKRCFEIGPDFIDRDTNTESQKLLIA